MSQQPHTADRMLACSTALRWAAGIGVFVVGLCFAPMVLIALLGINFCCWLAVAVSRLYTLRRAHSSHCTIPAEGDLDQPKVTVHVPCYNEPPEVVKQTLDALASVRWANFEVICLDNNTVDPNRWKPIQAHCERLGPRFKFEHVEGLEGAKAGALDLALSLSHPEAKLVAIVDADYRVREDFLERAWTYFCQEPDIAFVQFPQAYSNGAAALGQELAHYFELYMPAAQSSRAALLTGTLSVIRRDALEDAGGWKAATITEDAELGVRLLTQGWHGRYAPERVGEGLMPTDLATLRAQRRRWVRGNSDTLYELGRGFAQLGWPRGIAVFSQLTAWVNFLFVPILILATIAFLSGADEPYHRLTAQLAGASVLVQLTWKVLLLWKAPASAPGRAPWPKLLAHLGLTWEGATAWLERWFGGRLGFVRTRKDGVATSLRGALVPLGCALLTFLAAALFATRQLYVAAAGSLIACLALASVVELHRYLRKLDKPDSSYRQPNPIQLISLNREPRTICAEPSPQRHHPNL